MLVLDPSLLYATVAFVSFIREVLQKYEAEKACSENKGEAHTAEELEPLQRGLTLGDFKSRRAANRQQQEGTLSSIKSKMFEGAEALMQKVRPPVSSEQQGGGRIYLGVHDSDEEISDSGFYTPSDAISLDDSDHQQWPRDGVIDSVPRYAQNSALEEQEERIHPTQESRSTASAARQKKRSTRSSENRKQLVQEIELTDLGQRQSVRKIIIEAHTAEELEPLQQELTLGDFKVSGANNRRAGTFSSIKNMMFSSAETLMQKISSYSDTEQHSRRHGGRIYLGVHDSDEDVGTYLTDIRVTSGTSDRQKSLTL